MPSIMRSLYSYSRQRNEASKYVAVYSYIREILKNRLQSQDHKSRVGIWIFCKLRGYNALRSPELSNGTCNQC
jgi:hypothetical protein